MKGRLKAASLGLMIVIPLILILIFAGIVSSDAKAPRGVDGVLDLSNWNFKRDGVVKLNGEWEFYWQQLLTYRDFQTGKNRRANFEQVPNVWNDYHHNGRSLPGQG